MRDRAIRFIVILGVVSLLSDMTYEGARSINGPFLATLGATGAIVGFVAGFGELIGQGLRLLFGYLSDRTKRYWAFTLLGYAVNLLSVPLLAFAGSWQLASVLIVAERLGKAIRTPARDTMLSHAASQIGRGKAFGIHEALDQIGALGGPLVVSLILYLKGDYRSAFLWLLLPASLALTFLVIAKVLYPAPQRMEKDISIKVERGFSKRFWLYLLAIAFLAAGYVDYPLIAFHASQKGIALKTYIPLLYSLAMAVDAISALICGNLFDRWGFYVLASVTIFSSLFAPLVFLGGLTSLILGVSLWGVGMGAQESILRAAIGEMVSPERRGTAYGLFNAIYGLSWFLGSAFIGFLYDISISHVVAFSLISQVISFLVMVYLLRRFS